MTRILLTLCLGLIAAVSWAQKKSHPQPFTGAAAVQEQSLTGADEEEPSPHLYLQVGGPIPYSHTSIGDTAFFTVRFPWDVAYIPLTFEESFFDISKGYYSDKVQVQWTVQANTARIDQFKIYRRLYATTNINDTDNYTEIATLASDSYAYEDTDIQGGVLYEYKVVAVGVSSIPKKYTTYITGIGFRNPTGVITGNISFDGGSPVRDVVVRADPQGGMLAFGSSIAFAGDGLLSVPLHHRQEQHNLTLQAWVKLAENTTGTLFRLDDHQEANPDLQVSYTTTANSLNVTVAQATATKTFTISDFYPTGNVDGRGDDLMHAFSDPDLPQNDFANNFAHLTIVLRKHKDPLFLLNGRRVHEDYLNTLPEGSEAIPSIATSGDYTFDGMFFTDLIAAQGLTGNVDELRVWSDSLDEKRIRTDFKRYLGGAESNLLAYIRCDEKVGEFAYDISKVGFEFNKNHAEIIHGVWSTVKPTSSQLGILGVTDAQGNYIISAIPFSGTGESYTITPMYSVHQFEPSQQLVFVGNGSEVTNKIDFKDISSFDFRGVAAYTTDGVFAPNEPVENVTFVEEAGYNEYRAIINGSERLLSKGEYRYDHGVLYATPKVYVAGANVYIDGNIVLDKDKRPVVTDQEGAFTIKVPIGEHYIEVRKNNHGFAHGGRFPAAREDGEDLFEFFEHQQSAVTFLDTTRVTLVGRVVGGTREAEKPIGFGYDGLLQETYNTETEEQETRTITSINNIGQASITLQYLPPNGEPGIGELTHTLFTHAETGEYKALLLPLSYTINATDGLSILKNVNIQILEANETVNLIDVPDPVTSAYLNAAGDSVYAAPYHFEKSFTYRATPVLNVKSQSSDTEVEIKTTDDNGNPVIETISTDGFQYPVYTQGASYAIVFETYEEYVNYDGPEPVEDRVPTVDGEFNITNNLGLANSESVTTDEDNPSISKYVFRAGLPSISKPFTRSLSILYRVNGVDYDAQGYASDGIILGGQSDGSQTFVTKAPEVPDIILRDPPGSNSFASIEAGKSISFTEQGSFAIGQTGGAVIEMALGTKFSVGGGIAGPIIESEVLQSISAGMSLKVESSHGKSITKTYTFNETISTSDDPLYVGSDGDLYIGNTKNYLYGSYDNVQADETPADADYLTLTNTDDRSIVINRRKAFYFSEEPTNTFFIYSQKHILENLIPELEGIIKAIDLGDVSESTPGVLSRADYEEQIRLWRKVIQDNERTKYLALYEREEYKAKIEANLQEEIEELNDHIIAIATMGSVAGVVPTVNQIGAQTLAEAITMLEEKKQNLEQKLELLEKNFLKNVSFDAGVGAYTYTSQISVAQQMTRHINLSLDASLESTLGFKVNKTGLVMHTSHTLNGTVNAALSEDETESTLVSYTLKDHDRNNFLSVDVVNTFDGNGPVFSTIGGRTSCPYEGIDMTLFYNNAEYKSEEKALGFAGYEDTGTIYSGGEQISYATQAVEVPVISVEVASVTDVPEERAAEFKLILENNSLSESAAYYLLYVDNTTNPHNAVINIAPNGTVVYVPYGQQVEYALTLEKSISDVYEYKDIDIVLASVCDGIRINDRVTLSAVFRPSCTAVNVDAPLDNWVFNAEDAFNPDHTTNPLSISMFGYNRAYASFENFRLEYRKRTSPTWTRLQTYYNTPELLAEAMAEGEDQGTLITANSVSFPWDIGALGLSDGPYELRAVSSCSNGTVFVSDVVSGTVDLNVPVPFGTPAPTDGILGPGEDLRLQFSEDIVLSTALSKIEILGETNQQPVDHAVSLHFEGAANNAIIEKPGIPTGDFSMEFWLRNQTTGSGVLFSQENGMVVAVSNGVLQWTFGGQTLAKAMATDNAFHHYTLTFNATTRTLHMYQDDQELGILPNANGLELRNDASLVIGGNTFTGNLHDLRLWSKSVSLAEAYARQYKQLTGSERDLIGYWPMNEGSGTVARDRARFRHALVNATWDLKPKGTAYAFTGGQYLELDDVNFVQLTDQMDVTLSFWMKTSQRGRATIFSNGRGNGDDLVQTNGKRNKWSVTLDNGRLYLYSEGKEYALSPSDLADDVWHHVAIVLRRNGSLKTYVDAKQESATPVTEIGGLSGNRFWIGARGYTSTTNEVTVDEVFQGKLDEVRLWNLARATEQIERDRFYEVPFNATGLMLYARMNVPDPVTGNGPSYYHVAANETVIPSYSQMNNGTPVYTDDGPGIKQVRPYLTFQVSHVINGDEMILTPLVSDWSVLEGQIIDITVDRMFDVHGNRQASPVTWSAYVRRNEVSWFTDQGAQSMRIEKEVQAPYSFTVTLVNKGGKKQPYTIDNLPGWLHGAGTSGVLDPQSTKTIVFDIDPGLAVGAYTHELYLDTDFNFDEKIVIDLRVLGPDPGWNVDPAAWEYSMNFIGKVRLDGTFLQDSYARVAGFAGDELRGVARLEYDANYDDYFVYLTLYSNVSSGEELTFRLWDAATGKIYQALVNGEPSIGFMQNEVIGFQSMPAIFEGTNRVEQHLHLHQGWTWISLYANDPALAALSALTAGMQLAENDIIKGQLHFDVYDPHAGWNGSLSQQGGLSTTAMYKVRLGTPNILRLAGEEVDIGAWTRDLSAGWNWLAFPMASSVSIDDALALLDAQEGDVIKNQKAFAIYDPRNGWSGTLAYLTAGDGYMLKTAAPQLFRYPQTFRSSRSGRKHSAPAVPHVPDWTQYEHNMNIVASLESGTSYDSLWVLDQHGAIRAAAAIRHMDGQSIGFLTVFGGGGNAETLRVYAGNEHPERAATQTIAFGADQVLGTLRQPVALRFDGETQPTAYPNAFEHDLRVQFSAGRDQNVRITLRDNTGKPVYEATHPAAPGFNQVIVTPDVSAGLYLLTLYVDGRQHTMKVIRKH